MKPSSLRILAISTLIRDEGRLTSFFRALAAFRIRVSISAIGSVRFMGVSFP
jgi:hypothetical protein